LRPLINHFDSAKKLRTLENKTEGIPALEQKPDIYLNSGFLKDQNDPILIKKQLRQYFRFKAHGKGTIESKKLEQQFYNLFRFTSKNPLLETTLGKLGFPIFQYKTSLFWGQCKNGIPSVLVSGLCPLSTINDELGFKLKNGEVIRPELGFSELTEPYQNIESIIWPERPILTDYIKIRTILELYKEHQEYPNLSVMIWYPYHEYLLDLTENIFPSYLYNGLIELDWITNGLNELKERYQRLFDVIEDEVGLVDEDLTKNINFNVVNKSKYEDLELVRERFNLSFFKYIYGSWTGNELRRKLYEQLVIKHMLPTMEGKNVLHLDTSYELWVDILAAILVEKNKSRTTGNYCWINYPSLPSIKLSHMREFNAPYNDKLYLAEEPGNFKSNVDKLSNKYLLYVAPIILGKEGVVDQDESTIIKKMKRKLLELNRLLMKE
jgi:hypothetical protein